MGESRGRGRSGSNIDQIMNSTYIHAHNNCTVFAQKPQCFPYSESANSARPALELRYSLLFHISAPCPKPGPLIVHIVPWGYIPLNSPLNSVIGNDEWRHDVSNLVSRPAHGVENALCEESVERPQSVVADAVGSDALAGLASALVGVSERADMVTIRCASAGCLFMPRIPRLKGMRDVYPPRRRTRA